MIRRCSAILSHGYHKDIPRESRPEHMLETERSKLWNVSPSQIVYYVLPFASLAYFTNTLNIVLKQKNNPFESGIMKHYFIFLSNSNITLTCLHTLFISKGEQEDKYELSLRFQFLF